MVEFSPVSGGKKIHDLTTPLNDSLPAPSLTLPEHKGPNSSALIDPFNVAKALDKNGFLSKTTPEVEIKVYEAMIINMAIAVKEHL